MRHRRSSQRGQIHCDGQRDCIEKFGFMRHVPADSIEAHYRNVTICIIQEGVLFEMGLACIAEDITV